MARTPVHSHAFYSRILLQRSLAVIQFDLLPLNIFCVCNCLSHLMYLYYISSNSCHHFRSFVISLLHFMTGHTVKAKKDLALHPSIVICFFLYQSKIFAWFYLGNYIKYLAQHCVREQIVPRIDEYRAC